MKKEKVIKDVKISVRISRTERDFAEKVLKSKGIKLSKFIRQALFDFIENQPESQNRLSLS
jgi:hypothetical protein